MSYPFWFLLLLLGGLCLAFTRAHFLLTRSGTRFGQPGLQGPRPGSRD